MKKRAYVTSKVDGLTIKQWVSVFARLNVTVSYGTLWVDRKLQLEKGLTESQIAARWYQRHAPEAAKQYDRSILQPS